jgi:hypothetical protein
MHNANSRIEHDAAPRIANLGLNNRLDPFFRDRFDEHPLIALILVRILDRKLANRLHSTPSSPKS